MGEKYGKTGIIVFVGEKRKVREVGGDFRGSVFCCYVFGFILNCFVKGGFELNYSAGLLFDGKTFLYTGAFCGATLFIALYYYYTHR